MNYNFISYYLNKLLTGWTILIFLSIIIYFIWLRNKYIIEQEQEQNNLDTENFSDKLIIAWSQAEKDDAPSHYTG